MSFFRKLFTKKTAPTDTYEKFWAWFTDNAQEFYAVVKSGKNIENDFFDKLSPRLADIREGYFYVTGMLNDYTAELILTADGEISNIAFIEDLAAAAPTMSNWKITALKPALDITTVSIRMAGLEFKQDNLYFFENTIADKPDEIDITIVYPDMTDDNETQAKTGVFIFLDNLLGELALVNTVDSIDVTGKAPVDTELIPIEKLPPYLNWRQKEFLEKYEDTRYDTTDSTCSMLQGKLDSGLPLIAVINTDLLEWDRKASHPWIAEMKITYDGSRNNGLPAKNDLQLMNTLEEELNQVLSDKEGYLNVGRQTANNERHIYFACRDFRHPSRAMDAFVKNYASRLKIETDIYKDKYWQSFERFRSGDSE